MTDVKLETWYIPNGTLQQNLDSLRAYIASFGKEYYELTDTQKAKVRDFKEQLEQISYEANKVKSDFFAARDAAFKVLRDEHDAEMISLGQLWQGYEDNNYTIPQ